MTQIKFAVIDNKRIKRGHNYNLIYVTDSLEELQKFIKEKNL